jgi:hypothetical protein
MDVDLSTGLEAFLPLVAPLLSGHSELAIGTRLAQGAAVLRGPRRELISRCYNLLLRALLGARFSDAQCGFKAGRTEVLQALLPAVEDQAWFFDTELLLLAERNGLRIHEVRPQPNAGRRPRRPAAARGVPARNDHRRADSRGDRGAPGRPAAPAARRGRGS